MKRWEFSGNLKSDDGIKNYQLFQETVNEVMREFQRVFSEETMHKYPLLIDNALAGSGYTPIITPILGEFLIIKLGIDDGTKRGQTVFQVAHELTHLVFYSLMGINKEMAGDEEESICTAVSLCLVASMVPNELEKYANIVVNEEKEGYRKGFDVAREHGFSFTNMKNTILKYSEKISKNA